MPMMLDSARIRFAHVFWHRQSEWLAAMGLTLLGVFWTINDDLFTSSEMARTFYGNMLYLAPQNVWATGAFILGAGRTIILVKNGGWKKSPHLRAGGAFLSLFFWVQLMLSLKVTLGTGLVLALVFVLGDFLNFVRAMRDARTVDDYYAGSRIGGARSK